MHLSESPPINTERLVLRLVDEPDLTALLEVNADDSVTQYLPYATWTSIHDAQAWFDRVSNRLANDQSAQFAIIHRHLRCAIGTCLLGNLDRANGRAEIGYVLGRKHWGKGYMTEAMQSFLDFAFNDLSLRRLEAELDPHNEASTRLLHRLGFVREGLLRERWCLDGEVSDSAIYGLLREQWCSQAMNLSTSFWPNSSTN